MVSLNPADEIAKYKERLNELYDLVEQAVRQLEPGATLGRADSVQLNEELTGPYSAPTLVISIPGKAGIRLVPKGIFNIGARGRVDARSRLGTQVLVWVEAGGPALELKTDNVDSATRPVFQGVPEGWAWTDNRRVELLPLTERVFLDRVLPGLVA